MKLKIVLTRALVVVGAAAVLVGALSGCGAPAPEHDRLSVFVSIPPQAYFAERLVGELGDVYVMLPPGADSHSYEPRPSQLQALTYASLYVRIGADFEVASWDRIRDTNPRMTVVDGRDGVQLRHMKEAEAMGHSHNHSHAHDHGHDHSEGAPDPHLWLDPRNMQHQVRQMSDALQELDAANAETYAEREEVLIAELEALDRELRETLEPFENSAFWVYHPAWGYFADAYGLRQVAIEQEGKDPGSRTLQRLVRQAQEDDVDIVFVEPQFDTRHAKVIADEIGAEVAELDPLAEDYMDNLRTVAESIRKAVS